MSRDSRVPQVPLPPSNFPYGPFSGDFAYACEDESCEEWALPARKYDPEKNLKYCTRPGHRRKKMNRWVQFS